MLIVYETISVREEPTPKPSLSVVIFDRVVNSCCAYSKICNHFVFGMEQICYQYK